LTVREARDSDRGSVRAGLPSIRACLAAIALASGCGRIGTPDEEIAEGSGGDGGAEDFDAGAGADAAPPDACVPGWKPLLENGNFDEGPGVAWTATGADIIQIDGDIPINVDSGEYAALFGGRNVLDATLSQRVLVPGAATQLRLQARICFVTVETVSDADRVEVVLRGDGDEVVDGLAEYTNGDATSVCNWGDVQLSVSPAPAGDFSFEIHVTTNATRHTSFYFDTLVLEANMECGA
jgi:hypothetical protein